MNENNLVQIKLILEAVLKDFPGSRTVFCLDKDGLLIAEIGLAVLGRDVAREIISFAANVLSRANILGSDIEGDPWTTIAFQGDQSALVITIAGKRAILGLLIEQTVGKLPNDLYRKFSGYGEELGKKIETITIQKSRTQMK